jgi:hypothetical protein
MVRRVRQVLLTRLLLRRRRVCNAFGCQAGWRGVGLVVTILRLL